MSSNNTTTTIDVSLVSKSIVDDLNLVTQRFIVYLPLIFLIFGFIGFIGNVFIYLQAELRSNTCCIYSLCGSIIDIITLGLNLFPGYLSAIYRLSIPWPKTSPMCKLNTFLLVFLPHLSINFLVMAIVDRFASTCSLTSPIHRLNQMKMVPWMIIIAVITSCLATSYAPILYDLSYRSSCTATEAITYSTLYIIMNGILQPIIMLLFVLLTYRNIHQSRQRVGAAGGTTNIQRVRNQFIVMIFAQVFATAFFALQWTIMYAYYFIVPRTGLLSEQLSIISFALSLTRTCYYLNNVKSFYLSMLTSHVLRKVFVNALFNLFPRQVRQKMRVLEARRFTRTKERTRREGTH